MKSLLLASILFLVFACTNESSNKKLLSFEEITNLVNLNGDSRETFMLEHDYKPLSNENNIQSFIKGLNKNADEKSLDKYLQSAEQVDFNAKDNYIFYRTFDASHYAELVKELKNSLKYTQEQTDTNGITSLIYENDSLLIATRTDMSVKIPQYIFMVKRK